MSESSNAERLIALVGQPNSGKTTLFNSLSESNIKTVNYPGATVDYGLGRVAPSWAFDAQVIDTPGIMGLSNHTPDAQVTIGILCEQVEIAKDIDCVVLVVDATQLVRHLYLVNRVKELGHTICIALTMTDLLERKGLELNIDALEAELGIPVEVVDGRTNHGVKELLEKIKSAPINGDSKKLSAVKSLTSNEIVAIYKASENLASKCLTLINKTKADQPDPQTLRIDRTLLHPVFGLAIFILSMTAVFSAIFWIGKPLNDEVSVFFDFIQKFFESHTSQSWLRDLVSQGLIGGVGSVMTFLPQIVILFAALSFLEDSGYLSRGAMLMDRPLSLLGLNGRSFVPMLSGFACAIPAILAARTISNRKERFLTVFILPLMTCSARLPVYGLLLAFLTPSDKAWIGGLAMTALYLLGIFFGAIISTVGSKLMGKSEASSFMLELPTYRWPKWRVVAQSTYLRMKAYIEKAGPTIVVISFALWVFTHVPYLESGSPMNQLSQSYAGRFGQMFLDPIMRPMGFDWRVGVALICAFAAREVFVSALAIVLSVTTAAAGASDSTGGILDAMKKATITGGNKLLFSTASSVALMIFVAFALQCLSTVSVSRAETGGWKLPISQVVAFTGGAYLLAVVTYQILTTLGFG